VGTLSNRLSEAISSGCSVDKFHMDTLLLYFPPRARVSLQQKYFFRVQADGESLANYIANMKSYVKVFRLENSEADIVQTILDGLSPACRSYLLFADKPTSALIWIICVSRQPMPNMLISCDRRFPSLQLVRPRLVDPCPPAIHLGHVLPLSVFIATAKDI
jgi:hypothetical protein